MPLRITISILFLISRRYSYELASINPSKILVISSAIFYTVAVLTVYGAYQIGRNAAQISSLTQTSTILIVILAAVFLNEKDRLPRKFIAAVLSIIGVVLLK
jgi:uncharacterized membrane protein